MSPPWDALDAALASIGRSFGHDVARDLEAEGARDVADLLRGAIAGHPRGAGGKAAEAAWARLRSDAGWPSFAWRECYVIGQLRDAAEAGQAAADPSTAAADDASPGSDPAPPPRDATTRAILARRAMLAVDMTHIMGAPAELVHPFARAVEALARDLDDDGRRPTMTTTSRDDHRRCVIRPSRTTGASVRRTSTSTSRATTRASLTPLSSVRAHSTE